MSAARLLRQDGASRLRADERGVTIIEFALISPVLLLMLMAVFDMAHSLYIRSVLEGEMQRAGRASSLESAGSAERQAAIDQQVRAQVLRLGSGGTVSFTRNAFRSYSQAVLRSEPFIDGNHDGSCNNGESFEDWNGNNVHDADGARNNQGNARDVVVYSALASIPRLFPMAGLLGWPNRIEITTATVLKNQPFGDQAPSLIRKCP
jgi:Flp pilus assembly protein TadG